MTSTRGRPTDLLGNVNLHHSQLVIPIELVLIPHLQGQRGPYGHLCKQPIPFFHHTCRLSLAGIPLTESI